MDNDLGRDIGDVLAYRSSYYDLFRRIFLWELPLELFKELVEAAKEEQDGGDLNCSHDAALKSFLKKVPTDHVTAVYRDIQIEYTRLFLGPHHLPAPPYESVYRSPQKLMMQDVTMEVRSIYLNNGFRVARLNQEPDDTIGIELEFMCALSNSSMRAFDDQDCARLRKLVSVQREFCDLHLCRWVPQFCGDILKDTKSDFWKSVAVSIRSFLEQDIVELSDLMKHLEVPAEPSFAGEGQATP